MKKEQQYYPMLSFKDLHTLKKPAIIAHRGASAHAYENTIDAFDKAVAMRADGIELDVRRTRDKVLVVHHDEAITGFSIPISKMNISEIEEFNRSSTYQIPTLEQTLKHLKGKIALDIELKETGYETEVVDLAIQYYKPDNMLFTSFKKKSIKAIHEYDNNVLTGHLLNGFNSLKIKIPEWVDYILPHYPLCKIGFLKKIMTYKKPVIVWTVDNKKNGDKLLDKGISGLITNDPKKFIL